MKFPWQNKSNTLHVDKLSVVFLSKKKNILFNILTHLLHILVLKFYAIYGVLL